MELSITQPVDGKNVPQSKDWVINAVFKSFRWVFCLAMATLLILFVIDMFHRFEIDVPGITTPLIWRRQTKYNLCVISRVRNVPSLIPAWIEFNTLIGIQHFFIADDCSSNDSSTHYWLNFYEKVGLVTPFYTQPLNNCSNHHPRESYLLQYVFEHVRSKALCAWIGVIDPDEYIVPISNTSSLTSFTSNPTHIYLRIPWLFMGHSGHKVENNQSKLSTFMCGELNPHVKTFAREEVIRRWYSSHFPTFYLDKLNKQLSPNPFLTKSFEYNTVDGCDRIPWHGLTIRHYYHLSFQEHMKVRGHRKYASDGTKLPYQDWNISQHYTSWLSGNVSCSPCSRIGESYALFLAKQLNEQIFRKYRSLVTDPAYHIYRGIPFP